MNNEQIKKYCLNSSQSEELKVILETLIMALYYSDQGISPSHAQFEKTTDITGADAC